MKIRNVSTMTVSLSDLDVLHGVSGINLSPGQEMTIFSEDAEKSVALRNALDQGLVIKIGEEEPNEGTVKTTPAFIKLGDVPDTYEDQAGKAAVVNSCETGLTFATFAGSDEKVAVASGCTPNYLCNVLCAGSGVCLAVCGNRLQVSAAGGTNYWACSGGNLSPVTPGDRVRITCVDTGPGLYIAGDAGIGYGMYIAGGFDCGAACFENRVVVNGCIVVSGLTYPISDGAAGCFLCTNGSGTLGWGTAGGASGWSGAGTGCLYPTCGCDGIFICDQGGSGCWFCVDNGAGMLVKRFNTWKGANCIYTETNNFGLEISSTCGRVQLDSVCESAGV